MGAVVTSLPFVLRFFEVGGACLDCRSPADCAPPGPPLAPCLDACCHPASKPVRLTCLYYPQMITSIVAFATVAEWAGW